MWCPVSLVNYLASIRCGVQSYCVCNKQLIDIEILSNTDPISLWYIYWFHQSVADWFHQSVADLLIPPVYGRSTDSTSP